jgi:hypothetical protein
MRERECVCVVCVCVCVLCEFQSRVPVLPPSNNIQLRSSYYAAFLKVYVFIIISFAFIIISN